MVKNNLKQLLREKGLKHNFIAEKIGLEASYFSNIIKGKNIPSVEIALKLEQILGVPVNEIFKLINDK